MDREKIEQGVRLILEGVGEDLNREGLLDTPGRVARMYEEILSGMDEDPSKLFVRTFGEDHREMVLVKDIPIYSICEHHLAPFYGVAHVAYLPGKWSNLWYLQIGTIGRRLCQAPAGSGALGITDCGYAGQAAGA